MPEQDGPSSENMDKGTQHWYIVYHDKKKKTPINITCSPKIKEKVPKPKKHPQPVNSVFGWRAK